MHTLTKSVRQDTDFFLRKKLQFVSLEYYEGQKDIIWKPYNIGEMMCEYW